MGYYAHSQDIIVTNQGDTIDCKITRLTDDFIHFSVYDKSGVLLMRSRLPLSGISHYSKGEVEETMVEIKEEDQIVFEEFRPPSFRISLNTGYTYQFGGYEGAPTAYADQLQSLWFLGGDFHYFLTESFGVGVKYNRTTTNAEFVLDNPVTIELNNQPFTLSSIEDEKVKFNYFAVSLMYRNNFSEDQAMNYYLAAGVIRYRSDGSFNGTTPFFEEGNTFAVSLGLSYDFRFLENIGIGAGLEVNIARLKELDSGGTLISVDFPISRVNLTVGVRLFK